jgi:catechol 2,3-dioxygenase-like lactoylglutathione lyase family enzyme
MFDEWRRRRAVQRTKPGDGHALRRFRGWQLLTRSLFHLPAETGVGRAVVYAIDVNHLKGNDNGDTEAHLYRDGRHHARARVPAVFPIEGGTIEVVTSLFGLRRCHFVTDDGVEQQLVPDPRSAEGRRECLDREHPRLSRWIGVLSVILVVVPLLLAVPQTLEVISRIPPLAERLGVFNSPIDAPAWFNVALTISAVVGSTERALRLRYNRWLDPVAS